MKPQTTEQMPKKKSVCNKGRYEQNKEEVSKNRHERYRIMHKKNSNIKVSTGTFTLFVDQVVFWLSNRIINNVMIGKQKM